MVKLYVNTGIQSIDQEINDNFSEYICQAEEESSICLVSRKTVLPSDIDRLAQDNRKIILLVDSGDKDLIRAAKQGGVKDLLFSPVKIETIEKRISEMINEVQNIKENIQPAAQQTEANEDNQINQGLSQSTTQDDSLDELLASIKSQVRGSKELEVLRRENEELKKKLKRYEDFVAVLAEIFKPQTSKGVEKA